PPADAPRSGRGNTEPRGTPHSGKPRWPAAAPAACSMERACSHAVALAAAGAAGMQLFGWHRVLLQRPFHHIAQTIRARILCALDDGHEPQPIFAAREIGKAAHRARGIFASGFVETFGRVLDLCKQRNVVERKERLVGGNVLAEGADE